MDEFFLYEHGSGITFPGDLEELQSHLETIWQQRLNERFTDFWRESEAGGQRFLKIGPQAEIRARNYVGFIRDPQYTIHLLPKLYVGKTAHISPESCLEQFYQNILWWLSYTPFLQVPHHLSGMDAIQSDPIEIFIGLFATLARKTLNQSLFQAYENRSDELAVVRGRLDMPEYLRQCLTKARLHRVYCRYDNFEIDNLLNRVIKRVTRCLIPWTRRALNRQKLEDILYILDEVSDVSVQAQDCDRVQLNPMFEDYRPVLDYCRLFLQNSVSYAYKPELKCFSLLIPMERLFEQFLAGFLKTHQAQITGLNRVEFQKSDMYLAEEVLLEGGTRPAFQMRHDLLLDFCGKPILLDAKYKQLKPGQSDSGVSQSDLYQMLAYAVRRGVRHCGLIYPQVSEETAPISRAYRIPLPQESEHVNILANQIPFVHESLHEGALNPEGPLLRALMGLLENLLLRQ
ncbi:MAG: McrC family protein [Candidatus Sericytochromatia bacterium]